MNKTIKFACLSFLALTLVGCSDAVTKVKDANTTLFTIGKKAVTKGQLYTMMKQNSGGTEVLAEANKIIYSQEVEVTDAMKEDAKKTLESYKTMYGDSFNEYLKQSNMDEESYLNDYLLPSLQAKELPKKFVEANLEEMTKQYQPTKAIVISVSSQENAESALQKLKDGTDVASIISEYQSSSLGTAQIYTTESADIDSLARTVLLSTAKDQGWISTPNSDGSAYYLIKVEENDVNAFKDEAISTMANITDMSKKASAYYLKKYNFAIYDKVILDQLQTSNPEIFN